MHSLAHLEIASIGAGFKGGRVSVRVTFDVGRGLFHFGIERQGCIGHVIADEPNDDGVPEKGCWARQSLEELAGKMRMALLAEFTKAGANSWGFECWQWKG